MTANSFLRKIPPVSFLDTTRHKERKPPELNHYVVLISIIGAGLSLFLYNRYNRETQANVTIITAVAYVIWGILHHKFVHYLTIEIVAEYVLVAAIGTVFVLSLIGF